MNPKTTQPLAGKSMEHGGEISVVSRLNEGTTFTVRLPKTFEPEYSADQKSIACYSEI